MNLYSAMIPFLKIIFTIITLIGVIVSVKAINYLINHSKILNHNKTLMYASKDLIKYIIYVIALIIIFNIFGIDLRGIALSIGIVGIAASFAAKDIISNFMSGFFLLTDKTLEVGDTMQINTWKGKIEKIGLRNTVINTEDGDTIIIPNSSLSTTPYARFKKHETEKSSLNITVPLDIDIEELKMALLKTISENEEIMKEPKPTVETQGISKDGSLVTVNFWVKTFNKKEEQNLIITNYIREIINERDDKN